MKLNQHKTQPAIRSELSFSEVEVIEALAGYAYQKGYIFDKSATFQVYFPCRRSGSGDMTDTKLITQQQGITAGISEKLGFMMLLGEMT